MRRTYEVTNPAALRERAVATLERLLESDDEAVRMEAARALGEVGAAAWTPESCEALASMGWTMRLAFLEGLLHAGPGTWDESVARPMLEAGLATDGAVRRSCARLLALFGSRLTLPSSLDSALTDADPEVRTWVAIALSRGGRPSHFTFIRLEEDLDRTGHSRAAEVARELARAGLPGLYALVGRLHGPNAVPVARALALHAREDIHGQR